MNWVQIRVRFRLGEDVQMILLNTEIERRFVM